MTLREIGKHAGPGLPDLDCKPDQIVAVGDLDSDDVGTGARMNADKLAVDMIPVRHWVTVLQQAVTNRGDHTWEDMAIIACLKALARFQEGRINGEELLQAVPHPWFNQAVEVFVYGAKEYKPWNWLKGMPWSVPLACAVRHAKAHVLMGEYGDKESGWPHYGHLVCNLVMLATYYDTYKAGNDFPDPRFFGVK